MARQVTCDVCKKATPRIVLKMFLTPTAQTNPRARHSEYTGHADVGECCAEKIIKDIHWQKRRKRKAKAA